MRVVRVLPTHLTMDDDDRALRGVRRWTVAQWMLLTGWMAALATVVPVETPGFDWTYRLMVVAAWLLTGFLVIEMGGWMRVTTWWKRWRQTDLEPAAYEMPGATLPATVPPVPADDRDV